MVHEYYIKRGSKKFGPYYYESYREGNKVKKRYIGDREQYSEWMRKKEAGKNVISNEAVKRRTEHTNKTNLTPLFLVFGVVALLTLGLFLSPVLTGFVTNEKTSVYSEGNAVQMPATVGEPVKWQQTITTEAIKEDTFSVKVPDYASNIKINGKTNFEAKKSPLSFFKSIVRITGMVIEGENEIIINVSEVLAESSVEIQEGIKNSTESMTDIINETPAINEDIKEIEEEKPKKNITIEYETPAPKVKEEKISNNKKRVTISSEVHYENINASASLDENLGIKNPENVRIFWVEENEYININSIKDTDNDGAYDYVEWNVPHLSEQNFIIIVITKAEHLDAGRNVISDIYNEVYALDNVWSEQIDSNEYVRVTFERELTSANDITVYPRIISGNPKIEVYEVDGTEIIAKFSSLNENEYNKVLLTNLQNNQTIFDLKILNGAVQLDYIVDPGEAYSMIVLYNGTNIPADWTCISCSAADAFNGAFIRGNNIYGGTGGQTTHDHSVTSTMSGANTTGCAVSTAAGSNALAHTHEMTLQQSLANNTPPFRALKLIRYNNGVPATVPANTIGLFNTTPPAGWTNYTQQNTYYVRTGNSSTSTGGNTTHRHSINISLGAAAASNYKTASTVTVSATAHNHTISQQSTNASDNLPPTAVLVFAHTATEVAIPAGFIGMFNATLSSSNWVNMSNGGESLNGKFIKAGATYSTIAGGHTHANVLNIGMTGAAGDLTNGKTAAITGTPGAAHGHTINLTSFNETTPLPLYKDVIFAWYNPDTIKPTWESNLTNATSPQAGDSVYFNVTFTEANPDTYKFATNQSGSWVNYSGTYTSGVSITNVTILTATAGQFVSWYFWANDTSGNVNQTDVWGFTVTAAPTNPKWSNNLTNASSSTKVNQIVYFNVTWTDALASNYKFATNQSGSWVNYTGSYTDGASIENLTNVSATRGKTVAWYFWANDTSGNSNQTDVWGFTVANTAPSFNQSLTDATVTTPNSLSYQVNCSDVDEDSLLYYVNESKVSISAGGLITDTPAESEAGSWTVNVTCGDGYDNTSQSFIYTINDGTKPTWSNNGTNASSSTKVNQNVYFNATLSDSGGGGYYKFAFYNGSAWANTSATAWTSPSNVNNVTTVTATRGMTIQAYWWFNDSAGNVNTTDTWGYTIANTAPTAATLGIPVDNNITNNRTPFFNWTQATDADGDNIYYFLMINCSDNGGTCSLDKRTINVSGTTNISYVLDSNLKLFGDDNYYYNWSVVPYDGYDYGTRSAENKLTLNSLVQMSLTVSGVNFSTMNPGDSRNTTNLTYPPLVIENSGNCFLNMNISANNYLWTTQSSPSTYYRYKVNNITGHEGAFNSSISTVTWTNIPNTNGTFINHLNYSGAKNSSAVDILVTVPTSEPPGAKTSVLVFTGWYVKVYE